MNRVDGYTSGRMWRLALLLIVVTAGCSGRDEILGVGDFVTTPPLVTSVTPADGATDVPFATPAVTATFNVAVAPFGGSATFVVSCELPCTDPTGTVSLDGPATTVSFTLTPGTTLIADTLYTATVAGAERVSNGLAMTEPFIWTFTTSAISELTRPRVIATVPVTSSPGPTTGVAINSSVVASFSESMDPATIDDASFTLTCVLPCVSPTGVVSYDTGSMTAIFTADADLDVLTLYTATITTAATDLSGNELGGNQAPLPAASDYVWTFETGAVADAVAPTVSSNSPADLAIDACSSDSISATFSEAMNPLTISTATFTLEETGGAAVAGAVTYDVQTNIATFDPTTDLIGTPATNYTATIVGGASGVEDVAGNPLLADSVTTFTTDANSCNAAPSLGSVAGFGAFGGNATLTNDGLDTVINGDVAINASSTSVTGLRDSGGNVYTVTTDNDGLVNGLIYTLTAPPGSVPGAVATQARIDALAAFNAISPASMPGGIDVSSLAQCPSCGGAGGGPDELAGRVLPPGVYFSTSGTYDIGGLGRPTANLTLDAGGDADAVWVFQTADNTGTLNVGLTGPATPATPIQVLLINGAQAKNVFWYVPAGATIGTGSTMVGTMLSDAAISISTTGGSPPTATITTLNGRAISLTAGVTMTNTIVNVPAP